MTSKPKYKFGIFEIATISFVVLKLTGAIDWTWWWVFSPAIIAYSTGFIEGFVNAAVEDIQKNKELK
jgi:hypothetical protein